MRKSLYAALAAAALMSSLAVDASALPLPRAKDDGTSIVTQVRDGCGAHRHRLPSGRCVWDRGWWR